MSSYSTHTNFNYVASLSLSHHAVIKCFRLNFIADPKFQFEEEDS